MNRLLSANILRLRKSIMFWFFTICAFVVTVWYIVYGAKIIAIQNPASPPDEYMLAVGGVVPALCTLFVGFFLGTEYSDKTIRNKLIIGNTRKEIYIAYLVTVIIATAVMTFAWLLGGVFAILLRGGNVNGDRLAIRVLISLLYNSAFTSLLTIISMLITQKALAIIVQIEFARMSIMAPLMVFVAMESVNGNIKEFLGVIVNIMPMGQWMLSTNMFPFESAAAPVQAIMSLAVIVAVVGLGIRAFEQKEIR